MTDEQIKALAREYAEFTDSSIAGQRYISLICENFLEWVLRNYGLVYIKQTQSKRMCLRGKTIAGATEVLASQWKDPKVELPEEDEWVDVCICRYDGSIKYRFEARHTGDGVFVDEEGFKHDCISYWMRVPDPMPKGGTA